jgi:hypothetical protein
VTRTWPCVRTRADPCRPKRRSRRRRCGFAKFTPALELVVHTNPSPRASQPRHGSRSREIEKALGLQSTGWGQFVDKRLTTSHRVVRRWKAPRVRRIAVSFAGGRVRRPLQRALCKRGSFGEFVTERSFGSASAAQATPSCVVTISRHEVPEPIGLG